MGEGQRGSVGRRDPERRVVGALSARGYTQYTDQEFVRGGQLVTGHDIQRTGKNAEVVKHEGDATYYIEDCERGPVKAGGAGGTHQATYVAEHDGPTVRRLTPMECERLMGWPDGWTDIPWNKKDHAPDSRRYAACGNGVVAPVSYWIGARLAEVLAP